MIFLHQYDCRTALWKKEVFYKLYSKRMQRTPLPKVSFRGRTTHAVSLAVIGLLQYNYFTWFSNSKKLVLCPPLIIFFPKKKLFGVIPQNIFFAEKVVRPDKHVWKTARMVKMRVQNLRKRFPRFGNSCGSTEYWGSSKSRLSHFATSCTTFAFLKATWLSSCLSKGFGRDL